MKTYYLSNRKLSIYSVIGFVGLMVSSCGSYQNSSYYDNDGVYGSERPRREYNRYSEQNMAQANNYKEYFSDLQKDANNGVFTDVDSYSSQGQEAVSNTNQNEYAGTTGYAGWGDNSSNITVNVYNNDPWYWNRGYWNNWYTPYYGWGWNNYYYGSGWGISLGWGWGWNSWYGPNWGWGWNNWYGPGWGYYGNGWYNGYYNNRVYHTGPRGGSAYYNGRYNNSVYGTGTRNYNTSRRSTDFNATRNYGTGTRDYNNYNNGTRNYNSGTRNYNNSGTRDYNNNSGTRNYNNSGTRDYNSNSGTRNYNSNSGTRNNSSYTAPTRSYNSSGSFGGSRSGGSYGGSGGGRSGGGGRR